MGTVKDNTLFAKVVFYGPAGAGKSESLRYIASKLKKGQRGELEEVKTGGHTYEVLPVSLGEIKGLKTEFQFIVTPGGDNAKGMRKALAFDADGIIFVANSRGDGMKENKDSLAELEKVLSGAGRSLVNVPVVFQWNNQKVPGSSPPDELAAKLNTLKAPAFSVSPDEPGGILQAFTTISKITLKKLREDYDAGLLRAAPAEVEASAVPMDDGDIVVSEEIESESPLAGATDAEFDDALEAVSGSFKSVDLAGDMNIVSAGTARVGKDGTLTIPITVQSPRFEGVLNMKLNIKLSP